MPTKPLRRQKLNDLNCQMVSVEAAIVTVHQITVVVEDVSLLKGL